MVLWQFCHQFLFSIHEPGFIGNGDDGRLINVQLRGLICFTANGNRRIACHVFCLIIRYVHIPETGKAKIQDGLRIGIMGFLGAF